jgi:hypothetical protein
VLEILRGEILIVHDLEYRSGGRRGTDRAVEAVPTGMDGDKAETAAAAFEELRHVRTVGVDADNPAAVTNGASNCSKSAWRWACGGSAFGSLCRIDTSDTR